MVFNIIPKIIDKKDGPWSLVFNVGGALPGGIYGTCGFL